MGAWVITTEVGALCNGSPLDDTLAVLAAGAAIIPIILLLPSLIIWKSKNKALRNTVIACDFLCLPAVTTALASCWILGYGKELVECTLNCGSRDALDCGGYSWNAPTGLWGRYHIL